MAFSTSTSSPGLMSAVTALKIACLPPTVMVHCFGVYSLPKSSAMRAQMACLSGRMPPVAVYLVKFSFQRAFGGGLDIFRRGEIRLACAEVKQFDALRAQRFGFGDNHGHR